MVVFRSWHQQDILEAHVTRFGNGTVCSQTPDLPFRLCRQRAGGIFRAGAVKNLPVLAAQKEGIWKTTNLLQGVKILLKIREGFHIDEQVFSIGHGKTPRDGDDVLLHIIVQCLMRNLQRNRTAFHHKRNVAERWILPHGHDGEQGFLPLRQQIRNHRNVLMAENHGVDAGGDVGGQQDPLIGLGGGKVAHHVLSDKAIGRHLLRHLHQGVIFLVH